MINPKPRNSWLGGENGQEGGRQRETRWLTPRPIVDAIGGFDLDPCGAPGHDLAARTFLLERGEDGLALPWFGRVWLNPPYGPAQLPFMRKLVDHGNGVALIFARTETMAFQETVWNAATSILFLRGRLKFLTAEGEPAKANAGAPSCLVAFGDATAEALAISGLPGHLVHLSPTQPRHTESSGHHAQVRRGHPHQGPDPVHRHLPGGAR